MRLKICLLVSLLLLGKVYAKSDTLVINTGSEIKLFLAAQVDSITFYNFSKGKLTAVENEGQKMLSKEFTVSQNYPNPFNPSTRLSCYLPAKGNVAVRIYDINGGLIKQIYSGEMEQGSHEFMWKGRNEHGAYVASGLYVFSVQFQNVQIAKKIVLLK